MTFVTISTNNSRIFLNFAFVPLCLGLVERELAIGLRDQSVNNDEAIIGKYFQFYVARAYFLKAVQNLVNMVYARTKERILEVVSEEVRCHMQALADKFGTTLSTIYCSI